MHWKSSLKLEKMFRIFYVQNTSEPEFYGDLVYKFKTIIGGANFSDQFKKQYHMLLTYWI